MRLSRMLSALLAIAIVLAQIPLPAMALAQFITYDLTAGQHYVVGTVSTWHDEDTLYVLYDTNDNWQLKETHAWITDTLPTSSSDLAPGHAQDSGDYDPPVDSDTLELPLGSHGPGDCFYVFAHAAVVEGSGNPVPGAGPEETAWGGDQQGEDDNGRWYFYFRYCIPEETTLGTITVTKLDGEGSELAGAEFTLYEVISQDRVQVGDPAVTGTDGQVIFDELEAGTYIVVETGVPFGYKADDTDYESNPVTLTLVDGTVSSESVTFTNTLAADGRITVYKEDGEGEILDGASFTLYRLVDDSWQEVAGPVATSEGMAEFTDLLPGTYRVVETTVPSGYTGDEPQQTTLAYNPKTQTVGTAELTFVNEEVVAGLGSITVRKWVTTGVRLYGATFSLYHGTEEIGEVTLDGTHEHTWPNLPAGTYRVTEVSAPDGFAKKSPAYQDVELVLAGETVSSVTVDFYNDRQAGDLPASITVIKWDSEPEYDRYCIVSDQETEVADGRSAALATGPMSTWNAPTDIAAMVASGAEWIWESPLVQNPVAGDIVEFWRSFDISGVPVSGTLMITADNGYEVSLNGTLVGCAQVYGDWESSDLTEAYATTSNWQSVETYDVSGLLRSGSNTLYIEAANEYMGPIDGQSDGTPTSNPGGVIFRLCLGVASGTLLDEAEFTLSQDAMVRRGPDGTTNGRLTWEDVSPGTYTITETTVPSGFTGGDPQDMTVGAGDHAVVEFVNQREEEPVEGSITVLKLDDDTDEELPGATIEVRQGSMVVRSKTMTDGTYTFTGLGLGTYDVVEVDAPNGYELAADPSETVTLTEEDPDETVTFRNKPGEHEEREVRGSITVRKVDAQTGAPLAGAKVEVRQGSTVVRTTTMTGGSVVFGGLELGTYDVLETSAPAGYELAANASETVTLTKGSPDREVTFENAPIPDVPTPPGAIEGYVTEKDTGRILPGASVPAFDSEGHPWRTPVISDANGFYRYDNVPPGTYSVGGFLSGYSPDSVNPVIVVSGETTQADLVLAKEETIVVVPPEPPAQPPNLPTTGVTYIDPAAVGLGLLVLGAVIRRRRYQAKH